MTAMGQTRKSALATAMSAFSPIATKLRTSQDVSNVPDSEVVRFGVATLIHDVGASLQSHIGRPE